MPNGVLLFEVSKQAISFANKEMYGLLGFQGLKDRGVSDLNRTHRFFSNKGGSDFKSGATEAELHQEFLVRELKNFKRYAKDDDAE